jgi:hypothetical protein
MYASNTQISAGRSARPPTSAGAAALPAPAAAAAAPPPAPKEASSEALDRSSPVASSLEASAQADSCSNDVAGMMRSLQHVQHVQPRRQMLRMLRMENPRQPGVFQAMLRGATSMSQMGAAGATPHRMKQWCWRRGDAAGQRARWPAAPGAMHRGIGSSGHRGIGASGHRGSGAAGRRGGGAAGRRGGGAAGFRVGFSFLGFRVCMRPNEINWCM